MKCSPEDRRAMRQCLAKVAGLADRAVQANDTEAVRSSLWALSLAVLDAQALAKAIEDNTRNAALAEVEARLEQMVGMEAESL